MTFARRFAIVAVLLVTALVGQTALYPDGGVLLAQNEASQAQGRRLRLHIHEGDTLRLESGDDGRVRLEVRYRGGVSAVVDSAGFDLIPNAGAGGWSLPDLLRRFKWGAATLSPQK